MRTVLLQQRRAGLVLSAAFLFVSCNPTSAADVATSKEALSPGETKVLVGLRQLPRAGEPPLTAVLRAAGPLRRGFSDIPAIAASSACRGGAHPDRTSAFGRSGAAAARKSCGPRLWRLSGRRELAHPNRAQEPTGAQALPSRSRARGAARSAPAGAQVYLRLRLEGDWARQGPGAEGQGIGLALVTPTADRERLPRSPAARRQPFLAGPQGDARWPRCDCHPSP